MSALFVLLAVLLLLIFALSSIQAGHERFWFAYCLVIVPLVAAATAIFALDAGWLSRLLIGLAVLVVTPIILWQIPRFADAINDDPVYFRSLLPFVIGLERLYLATMPNFPGDYERHEAKAKRWKEITGR